MILVSWRKTFVVVFATDSSEKRPEFLAKTFLLWSTGMVAARWNLVRTECGPLVQKVANSCFKRFWHHLNFKATHHYNTSNWEEQKNYQRAINIMQYAINLFLLEMIIVLCTKMKMNNYSECVSAMC